MFFHNGAFVIGNIETHDHICRDSGALSEAPLLSRDYRLAPQRKYSWRRVIAGKRSAGQPRTHTLGIDESRAFSAWRCYPRR
ncbi:alpha/beta hydrolase fold domain-containing protein [Noviherbaspirillum pedocola]|uniref:alpha/beta hydrolase fold domain-containing protein n=1 Tax=Noviherbaspirillum pedocola TaxID=2801341 RepID=UPI00389956DF